MCKQDSIVRAADLNRAEVISKPDAATHSKRSNELSASRITYGVRCLIVSLVGICWWKQEEINSLIHWFYTEVMYHSPIFKHDSFEPVLSSTMFLVYITGWMLVDFYIPSLQRFRIQAASDNRAWKGREEAAYKEAAWYLLPLLVIDYFFPRRQLPSDAPTIGRIATEVVLGLVLYDAFFFLGHFCLHKSKYLMQKVHGKHHKNYSVRAPDAIHHTFIDGTWDVLCSVIALNVLRAHPMSRAIYNMVAIYLITEAHCGIEFPWMPHRVVPFHIVAGPVVHDRHHRNGSVNYQKFFTHLDYLAGTLQLNDPEMPTGEDGAKQQ